MANHKVGYVLGGIALIVFVAWAVGAFNNVNVNYQNNNMQNQNQNQYQNSPPPQPQPQPQPNGQVTPTAYVGQLNINLIERLAEDNTTPLTEGTNLATTYYKSLDGQHFQVIGSGTGGSITIDPAMGGIFYVGVAVPSGQNFLVAPKTIADSSLNPSVATYDFMDVAGLGQKVWVFQINLASARLPPIQGGQTAPTLTLYLNAYGYAAATINSPADIVNQPTGTDKTQTIYWILSGTNKDAVPISEVDVTVNSTVTSKYDEGLFFVSVPNYGNVYLNQMNKQIVGSTSVYQWKFQGGTSTTFGQPNNTILVKSLKSANYIVVPAQGGVQYNIPVQVATNFSSGDGLSVTLTVYWLQPSQSETSVSDCVKVVTASATGASC